MKIEKARTKILEGDLTPMIDMTFLLIAFFMLLINFSEIEKSEEIDLPDSVLARPPENPPEYQIVLNLDKDGAVIFAKQRVNEIDLIHVLLDQEIGVATREGVSKGNINVIIRADRDVKTGLVQDLMAKCQESDLELFSLRVNERLR